MGDKTGIEWTDATWNPVRGCSRVSEGCRNCYAERMAGRFSGPGQPYEGLARRTLSGHRWTGNVRLVPEHLADPLRWRKPRRVFVNSMSDLFHEGLSNEDIAAVFGVMAKASWHTYQVLTKRPARMLEWFAWAGGGRHVWPAAQRHDMPEWVYHRSAPEQRSGWPLPSVWLGVSVEDQATADERIPLLLQTPAAVRFVSYEPALGSVDFYRWVCRHAVTDVGDCAEWCEVCRLNRDAGRPLDSRIDWIIAGSESGPGARPASDDWYRNVAEQCRAAGVAYFMKQIAIGGRLLKDIDSFPEDLRIREWPRAL